MWINSKFMSETEISAYEMPQLDGVKNAYKQYYEEWC